MKYKIINDCPFCCEVENVYVTTVDKMYCVMCYACGATGPDFYQYDGCKEDKAIDSAIEFWNNCEPDN